MGISFRSVLTIGVATVTATAVAFGPAVQEPTPAAPPAPVIAVRSAPVDLAAQVQPLAVTDLPNLLVGWVQRFIVPPSASNPFPAPPSGPGPAPQSVTGTLEWAYHAIEPWVRYGFQLATYAVGWVPYVGWLSGQIMIFYNFGERIVHAIVHNTLDWLNGQGSFLFNLGEGIAWSIDALIQLGIDEWNFWLPPLPLLPFAAQATTTSTTENFTTSAAVDTAQLNEKHSALPPKSEAADVVDKKSEVDWVAEAKAPKEPKELKELKEPKTATPKTTESTKVKGDNGTSAPKANDDSAKKGPKQGDNDKKADNADKKKADKE